MTRRSLRRKWRSAVGAASAASLAWDDRRRLLDGQYSPFEDFPPSSSDMEAGVLYLSLRQKQTEAAKARKVYEFYCAWLRGDRYRDGCEIAARAERLFRMQVGNTDRRRLAACDREGVAA